MNGCTYRADLYLCVYVEYSTSDESNHSLTNYDERSHFIRTTCLVRISRPCQKTTDEKGIIDSMKQVNFERPRAKTAQAPHTMTVSSFQLSGNITPNFVRGLRSRKSASSIL